MLNCCAKRFANTLRDVTQKNNLSGTQKKVAELSLVLDSAFFVDVHGSLNLALEYMQQDPSAAYSAYCSEVKT